MPHQLVTLSQLAMDRMRQRRVSAQQVVEILANPDRTYLGARGNMIAEKSLGPGATVRVVFVDRLRDQGVAHSRHHGDVEEGADAMQFRLDRDVNALYIELQEGKVAKTLELAELVYADVDEHGTPLGLEFVNADDFIPFLRERVEHIEILESLRGVLGVPARG